MRLGSGIKNSEFSKWYRLYGTAQDANRVVVTGTWGAGGAAVVQGCISAVDPNKNNVTTAVTVIGSLASATPTGTAVGLSGMWVRLAVTGGDGTTALTADIL